MNNCILVEFLKCYKTQDSQKILKYLETFKKYDEEKKLLNGQDEFLIVCNFIEMAFYSNNISFDYLFYLKEKLSTFEKNDILNQFLIDNYFANAKRHEPIKYRLLYDYYIISVNYLLGLKKPDFFYDLPSKISVFVCLLSDLKSTDLQPNLLNMLETNTQIMNANISLENERLGGFKMLLDEIKNNPRLRQLNLVICLYLSDQYYREKYLKKCIEVILPLLKVLRQEIFLEENPFAKKIEILDNLMLLISRIVNCFYFLSDYDKMIKYSCKLNKYISLLKKSKISVIVDQNEVKNIINKYECLNGVYNNILDCGLNKKTNSLKLVSEKNKNDNKNFNTVMNYQNILFYLEKCNKNNFMDSRTVSCLGGYYNKVINEENTKLNFEKLMNFFMFSFEKQLASSKKPYDINQFYLNNIDYLKKIKICVDEYISSLKKLNNPDLLLNYFYFIVGYYNLIYFYHVLVAYEENPTSKQNYLKNLIGLCDNFTKTLKENFSPVFFTFQDNNFETPGNTEENNNLTSILKMVIENKKIKNIVLKIFFIHLNTFKYSKNYEDGIKLYDDYEKILFNFDLKDEISESLYFNLMKIKADYLVRIQNYNGGLTILFDMIKILDKKTDRFIEERAIILFNTGFTYLIKIRNSNYGNNLYLKDELKNVKNYFQESLNLFETIKYNRVKNSDSLVTGKFLFIF